MQLIYTVEISPYDFSNREYDSPDKNSAELPDEWYQFWKKCIADKNLTRLEPDKKGTYRVDIQDINDDELETILQCKLRDVDPADYEEQVGCLCGGIILTENDSIWLEPRCCGDIGNIREWETIFSTQENNWQQLWIGHPWVYYRKKNGFVQFSNYIESNPEDLKDVEMRFRIPESELHLAFEKISEQHSQFESRIKKVLNKMEVPHAGPISKLLTGRV